MHGFKRKAPSAPLRPQRFAHRFLDDLDRAFHEATKRADKFATPAMPAKDVCLLAFGESVPSDDSPPPSRPATPIPMTIFTAQVTCAFAENDDDEPLGEDIEDQEVASITASLVEEELPFSPCVYCGDQTNGHSQHCTACKQKIKRGLLIKPAH